MVHPRLLAYLRDQTAHGAAAADAAAAARSAGWSDADISAALSALQSDAPWVEAAQQSGAAPSSPWGGASAPSTTDAKGLVGLIIRLHLARTEQQANTVLVGLLIVALCVTAWNLWPRSAPAPTSAVPTTSSVKTIP